MTRPPKDIAAGVAIAGFTGVNGAGKTLLAVECALSDMAGGRTVYSTVPISSQWGNSVPLTRLSQLTEIRNATVLLDEVSVIFSARRTMSLPAEMEAALQTVRHSGNRYLWTAPNWMRCDTMLRGVTQAAVNVHPLIRGRSSRNDPWPRPRVVLAGLLDTSVGAADSVPDKVLRRRLFIPSRLASYGAYDTHADTPQLGMGKWSGKCECGGSLPTIKHTRERHELLGLPWNEDDLAAPLVLTESAADS